MTKTTRPGSVYRARSYDLHLTRRHISGIGVLLLSAPMLFAISALLFPGWWF